MQYNGQLQSQLQSQLRGALQQGGQVQKLPRQRQQYAVGEKTGAGGFRPRMMRARAGVRTAVKAATTPAMLAAVIVEVTSTGACYPHL